MSAKCETSPAQTLLPMSGFDGLGGDDDGGLPRAQATSGHRRWAFLAAPLCVVFVAALTWISALGALEGSQTAATAPPTNQYISAVFTPEIQLWRRQIVVWSQDAGIDPNLAATVMQIESCGNPFARSPAGALGLFQVMPDHFSENEDPFSPESNARRAMDYLRLSLAAADGNALLALAGYNGGIGLISEGPSSWPAETQRYAAWASAIYEDARTGASASPKLAAWISAGGDALCQSARGVMAAAY